MGRSFDDGLQVFGYSLTRSFADSGMTDVRKVVKREILAGNRFCLEALLVLKNVEDWTSMGICSKIAGTRGAVYAQDELSNPLEETGNRR